MTDPDVAALAAALRTMDKTDVACRLEPPQHADDWSPAIIAALAKSGWRIVNEATILAAFQEVGGTNQGDVAHARFVWEAIREGTEP